MHRTHLRRRVPFLLRSAGRSTAAATLLTAAVTAGPLTTPGGSAAAGATAAVGSATADAPGAPRPDSAHDALSEPLTALTTGAGAYRHLEELQRIADANGGNRASGTPGYDASAEYVGGLLSAAGYDVTYESFDFPYREPLAERLVLLDDGEERDIPVRTMTYTPASPDGGERAGLVEVHPAEEHTGAGGESGPAGAGCAATDFTQDGMDVTGRIVLLKRGECAFAEKQLNAADAGAVAAVIYNDAPGSLDGTLGSADDARIPTGGISNADGRALSQALAEADGPLTVELELRELAEERTTVNVLADSPGGDPARRIVAGAHLDSTLGGPGINDNGSGVAGVLETALRFAEITGGTGHGQQVRFAFWGAEELGKLGSEHHVARLSEEERDNTALYLNFDMIGSPNYGVFVYDGDGSEGLNEPGPPGSAQAEEALTSYLTAQGHQPRPTPFNGRSDYAAFIDAGIAAGGTFTGAEGVKNEAQAGLWGGTVGEPYDSCYHQACDDLTNVNRTALDINTRAIAHLVGRFAWSAESLTEADPDPAAPAPADRSQADQRLPEGQDRQEGQERQDSEAPATADSGTHHGEHDSHGLPEPAAQAVTDR